MKKLTTNKNKGFTLVETIAVLAIMGILLSISVAGFFGYIKYAEYKKNTEYARTIFTAAQSSLTNERANGTLEALSAKMSALDAEVPSGVTQYSGRLSYLFVQQGDLATEQASVLKSLLNGYIYDQSIYDATICIEFDPTDGVVYSVFYYDKDKDFSYGSNNGIDISESELRSDDNSARREIALGFWSASISAQAPGKFGKPTLSYVRLDNTDTLDLNWSLTSRYSPFTQFLSYNVKLYDTSNKIRFSLQVNTQTGNNSLKSSNASNLAYIDCPYEAYNSSGAKINEGIISIPAYINPNDVSVHVILDAVDLAAANISASDKTYLYSTTSSMKIAALCGMDSNLSEATVYAKVQAYGYGYTSSSWKQSSSQHLLMGKDSSASRFTLQSARHLFNLRFMCEDNDYLSTVSGSYVQTASFTWGLNNGIIANGKVYNTSGVTSNATIASWTNNIKVTDTNRPFPAIEVFYRTQTMDVSKSGLTINNLILQYNGATAEGLGLFSENYGTLQGLNFGNARVSGYNFAGTLCGKNYGVVKNITVSSGTVTGRDYVGGIVGAHYANINSGYNLAGKNVLDGLSNSAEVTGRKFVGGILGSRYDSTTITIQNCTNNGFIHAGAAYASSECQYIGGIIGYSGTNMTISSCVSSPLYNGSITSEMFKGSYIGGIAGVNYGNIISSSTGGGYVVGDTYVGGITGYNYAATLGDNNSMQRNKASVYGNSYVGGIAGCNTKTITNWSNEGIVSATTLYSGGIVGANGKDLNSTNKNAALYNCISNIDTASVSGENQLNRAEQFSSACDYSGGIAGYNYGTITSSSAVSCNSVAAGRNYVGGIVGCNTSEAMVVNYNISNAYVSGSSFVGGYIGLNMNSALFDNAIACNPSYIEGNYYTGGVIGANVVMSSSGGNLAMRCSVDNLQGIIQSKSSQTGAFFGGMVGYNAILNLPQTGIVNYCNELLSAAENLSYSNAVENVKSVELSYSGNSSNTVFVIGDSTARTARLKSINGNVYVGGVIGRNQVNTSLLVENLTNYASINAYGAISAVYNNEQSLFSYAGGITGHVTANAVIDNCTNNYMASVNTAGTYIGGLCEINEGIVRNCAADSQGASDVSYTGGLIGLNGGRVNNCSVVGSIRGLNYIGGIASNNYGTITDSTISGDIYGYGENIGGVAGYNTGTINGVEIKASVYGTGTNVGSVVGLNNNGTFTGSITMNSSNALSVQGKKNVGGFIGYNTGTLTVLDGLVNNANVSASEGFAGGIMGGMDSGSTVTATNCTNNGRIQANKGLAGGIIPFLSQSSVISNCANNAQVYAPDAIYYDGVSNDYYNGTFVAFNRGTIENCTLGAQNSDYTISGKGYVGGVTGYNSGTIRNITVTGTKTITVSGENGALYVGGIAGKNDAGSITDCKTDSAQNTHINVVANTNAVNIGGITGYNTGTVGVSTLPTEYLYDTYMPFRAIVSLSEGTTGNVGGLVGCNDASTVEGYAFEGTVSATGDENYGYGGIVGINSGTGAVIRYCVINDRINTFSNADMNSTERVSRNVTVSTTKNAQVPVGGIVGVNSTEATVEHCTLQYCYIRGDYGYVGGIAGHNYGTVENCKADPAMRPTVPDGDSIDYFLASLNADKNVKIYMYRGDIGGIVGRNERSGNVDNCATGKDWFVLCSRLNSSNNTESTDNTCAGIIGYNCTDSDITYNDNYARVYKGNLSGQHVIASGIIGRQENTSSSSWTISNCNNYGDIQCQIRVGGIIAQWKYKGGTVANCKNYGNITATSSNGVGGIIGHAYLMSSSQMMIVTDCANYGTITGSRGNPGGIVGATASLNGSTLNIVNCINTGEVKGSKPAGIFNDAGGSNVNILRCVNYYRFPSNGNGITSSRVSSVKGCVCIPSVINPIGSSYNSNSSQTDTQSYFLSDKTTSFSGGGGEITSNAVGLSVPTVTAIGSGKKDGTYSIPSYLTDGNLATYYNYVLNTGITNVLTATAEVVPTDGSTQTITLDKFDLTFFSSVSSPREYFYQVYYKVKGDSTEYLLSETGSGNNGEWATTGVINSSNGTSVTAHDNPGYNKTVTFTIPSSIVQTSGAESIKVVAYINGSISQKSNWICISEMSVEGSYKFTPVGANGNPDANKQAVPLYYKDTSALHQVTAANYVYSLQDEMTDLAYYPNDTLTHKTYSAYKYWYDLDSAAQNFILSRYNNDIGQLVSVILSAERGGYKVEWNEVLNAVYYDVDIYVGGVKVKTIRVDAGRSANFEAEASWVGQEAYAKVTAYNGASPAQTVSKNSNTVTVKMPLPEPKVVYELALENGTLYYYCRLMNVEQYRAIAVANGYSVDEFLKNIEINASIDGTSPGVFTAYEGRKLVNNMGGDGEHAVILEASATPKNETTNVDIQNYIPSSLYSIQTQSYAVNAIKNTKIINCTNADKTAFTGLSPEELSYMIKVRSAGTQAYFRMEYVVNRDVSGLTLPVCISSLENRMTTDGTYNLSGLNDIIAEENYYMRGYAWKTQADGLFFGHIVAENISGAQVLTLTDAYRNTPVVENNALNSGYSVILNNDDTYSVYYSTPLDCASNGIAFANYFGKAGLVPQKAAAPVLNNDYAVNGDLYTFGWSAQGTTASDKFKIQLEGTKADGSTVVILTENVTGYSYTTDSSLWEYKQVKLSVTRLGVADGEGYTTFLGSTSEKAYSTPLYLPTIFKPAVFIGSDKHSLTYDVSWNKPISQLALDDISGYSVMLTDNVNVTHELVTTADANTSTASVNLEAYAGQSVHIYIIARVKTPSANYSHDSRKNDNETASLTVSQRLLLGDPTYVVSKVYDPNSAISVNEFLQGVKLNVTNTITAQGSYALQAAVCSVGSTSDGQLPDSSLRLHDFAVDTTNPSTLTMTGDPANSLLNALYNFNTGIQRQYAAQYLWFRIRAVPTTGISSVWSPWQVKRLAQVKYDATDLTNAFALQNMVVKEESSSSGADNITVRSNTLSFVWDEYADEYTLHFASPLVAASPDLRVTQTVTIARTGGSGTASDPYTYEVKDGTGTVLATDALNSSAGVSSYMWNGYLQNHHMEIEIAGNTLKYDINAHVNVATVNVNNEAVVTVMLPDFDEYTAGNTSYTKAVHNTYSLSVIAQSKEGKYVDSDEAFIYQNYNSTTQTYEWTTTKPN